MDLSLMAFLGVLILAQPPVLPGGGAEILEDFERYTVGGPPIGEWESRGGDSKDEYSIKIEDGNHFLSAKDEGKSVQLFMKKGWDLKKFPILSWKWRARVLPEGADERHPKKNDSAAGVYVVFPRQWFIPETIKYVWSTTAPKDSEIDKGKGFHIVVLRSGAADLGKWQTESRNVAQDFEKLFGKKPLKPQAVGFLTDANAVKGKAEADYDDVVVSTK